MSDPVTASAAFTAIASMGGAAMTAIGNPGGGAQIDPTISAALGQQTSDIQQYQVENQADTNEYQKYVQQAKQSALDSALGGVGGAQDQAKNFIQSAFSGKPTDANINQLAQFDISGGRGMQAGRDQITNMMAQTGLDPRSPAYARAMAELESKLQTGFGGNRADLMSQQAQQNLATALPLYSALQNGPLAGTALVPTKNQQQNSADWTKYQQILKAGKFGTAQLQKLGWDKAPPVDPSKGNYAYAGVTHPDTVQTPTWLSGKNIPGSVGYIDPLTAANQQSAISNAKGNYGSY